MSVAVTGKDIAWHVECIDGDFEDHGCKINAIGVDDLFERYRSAGFLYAAKQQRLAPFWPRIRENWKRAMSAGESLLYVVTPMSEEAGWASLAGWRSAGESWQTQHLVGTGGPAVSRRVMLGAQAARLHRRHDRVTQNWFQRKNRFANKVFGSVLDDLPPGCGAVSDYAYLSLPIRPATIGADASANVRVREASEGDRPALADLATRARSAIYSVSEALDQPDLGLVATDEMYRRAGLRRYRRVLLAEGRGGHLLGAALACRGPLGMNFSFLENRCDLVLEPGLPSEARRTVLSGLLGAAGPVYRDFEPGFVPTVVDLCDEAAMRAMGGELIRHYAQSIWLRPGFADWYRHVERVYERAERAMSRRSAETVAVTEGAAKR